MMDGNLLQQIFTSAIDLLESNPEIERFRIGELHIELLPDNCLEITATNGHIVAIYRLCNVDHGWPDPVQFLIDRDNVREFCKILSSGEVIIMFVDGIITIVSGGKYHAAKTVPPADNNYPDFKKILEHKIPSAKTVIIDVSYFVFLMNNFTKIADPSLLFTVSGNDSPLFIEGELFGNQGTITAAIMPKRP